MQSTHTLSGFCGTPVVNLVGADGTVAQDDGDGEEDDDDDDDDDDAAADDDGDDIITVYKSGSA